ncbi:MAG: hypothetical protein V4671_18450 [Armatimonadota bacterium]
MLFLARMSPERIARHEKIELENTDPKEVKHEYKTYFEPHIERSVPDGFAKISVRPDRIYSVNGDDSDPKGNEVFNGVQEFYYDSRKGVGIGKYAFGPE